MDHYGTNNASTSSGYNSPIPSIAPQQLQQQHQQHQQHQQQNGSLPSLNAIHPQQGGGGLNSYPSMYSQPITAPHTPQTSAPNTPGSAGTGGFQSLAGQNAPQGYRPQPGPYQPSLQSYSSSGLPHSSNTMSHPQAIAPAPALAPAPRNLVPLRPMQPAMGIGAMQPGMSAYGQQGLPQENDTPTHVVGSQGRRGILPSAPGRPQVTATGPGSTKNAVIPAKDADGKFPCPHCTKTYLHAKHLKRHLLRHTGDRPYMCILCRDTFSRSDILKRHFQKCSIRRGNPTGASHLSHAQAHLKKNQPGMHKSTASGSGMQLNGLNPENSAYPFGIIPASPDKLDDNSPHNLSRANSLKGMDNAARDRRGMGGPTPNSSSRTSFEEQAYGGNVPSTMSSGMNPTLASFGMSAGQNGSSFGNNYNFAPPNGSLNPQGNDALSSMTGGRGVMPMYTGGQQWGAGPSQNFFQPGAQDGFMSSYNPSLGQSQVQNQTAIKAEPSLSHSHSHSHHGLFTGMYPMTGSAADFSAGLSGPSWTASPDPFSQVVHRIVNFCCPASLSSAQTIRPILSQDNIKHFLEQFQHFQGHFPILHMPTFHVTEASESLLLAMVCIGAVYSNRINPAQVRDLMEQAKSAIERNSHAYIAVSRGEQVNGAESFRNDKNTLENIQAIYLMQMLFVWHGNPVQRERVRRKFSVLVQLTKDVGLHRPSATPELFSVLHQPNVTVENVNSANFDWSVWVQQEKRSRLFYAIYLLDAAMVLYFNIPPQFDGFEINLPLPADDAAWEAKTATQCADTLGLHGSVAAKSANIEGSRRPKQVEMHNGLKSLMDPRSTFDAGNTNLYSKFVLMHALHVQLWRAQTSLAQSGENGTLSRASGTDTPVSQRSTPVDPDASLAYSLRLLDSALQKWKSAWDIDMNQQYPPASQRHPRLGFCRDGVHFFYLARYLLQNKVDWQVAPDKRFTHIMAVLKYVKSWALTDAARRGEDLGSVSEIDQDFGLTDLTLDMAQLFRPIDRSVDFASNSINIGHSML